jgi:hypothetical protein
LNLIFRRDFSPVALSESPSAAIQIKMIDRPVVQSPCMAP